MNCPTFGVGHVILDRDGVLNREAADGGWVTAPDAWVWEDGAQKGLVRLAEAGLAVSVVTNQSAVGRGVMTDDALNELHRWVAAEIQALGVNLLGIYACPHAPETGCGCRKPAPGLIERALAKARISARQSHLIGDDLRDLRAASAAGVTSTLVRTGKGRGVEASGAWSGMVAEDLNAAVATLLAREDQQP